MVPKRVSVVSLSPPTVGLEWHSAQDLPLKTGPSPSATVSSSMNSSLPASNWFNCAVVRPGRGSPKNKELPAVALNAIIPTSANVIIINDILNFISCSFSPPLSKSLLEVNGSLFLSRSVKITSHIWRVAEGTQTTCPETIDAKKGNGVKIDEKCSAILSQRFRDEHFLAIFVRPWLRIVGRLCFPLVAYCRGAKHALIFHFFGGFLLVCFVPACR